MKNNLKNICSFFFIFLFSKNIALANDFTFDVIEINILNNGNIINAIDGTATSLESNIKFDADEFQYNKILSTLNASNGEAFLIEKNIEIKADKFIYNQKKSILNAIGDIKLNDLKRNISIQTDDITYKETDSIIESNSTSIIQDDLGNIITTEGFVYTLNDKIKSNSTSTIKDNLGNIITAESFVYTLNDKLIKLNEDKITGVEKDSLYVEKAYFNLISKKLIGKDLSLNFNEKNFEAGNQPRLKGNSISADLNTSIIKGGVFTTCKKNDSCPPWQLSAKEIKHDKQKKTIYYKKAWLKIYDKPILYFPKFFHPDPTVKRQSGFLMPSFKNSSNAGSAFQMPYYHVISNNKDLTISPRFYSNEKILTQAEYREVNEFSEHSLDFSFINEKDDSFKSHFFLNTNKKISLSFFDESEVALKLEQVSNDHYLKRYKIESPIIKDQNTLISTAEFSGYKNDLYLDLNFEVYENLSKQKSDRYEYILPNYRLVKNYGLNNTFNGFFSFNSSGFAKNYNTNTTEQIVINDLNYKSNPKFSDKGFKNNYNMLIKNVNTDSKNSSKYKDQFNSELAAIHEFNSSYPVKKKVEGYENIFKPTISLRYSPNNSKNLKNEGKRIDVNNVFSINRLGTNDAIEGGGSITYGTEFLKTTTLGRDVLNVKIANIFRFKEEENLPKSNSLGDKTSDIFGAVDFSPNKVWTVGYEFAQSNNLRDTNFEIFKNQININNFITSFEYLNENNTVNKESYLYNKTSYELDNSNNIIFETRENKKTKLTEFYNLIYQYKNDCLIAALEYNKDYYNDQDLKPDESIFFKLTIIPFGQTSTPNLSK